MADQFDHLGDDNLDGFILYRRQWYHASDFMRIENNHDMENWNGYSSDSFFSGIVIKLSNDSENYMIGTYYS